MSLVGNSGAARRIPLSREHRAPQWESPPSSRSCPCTEAAALSLPGASMSPLLRLLGLRSPGPSFPPPDLGGSGQEMGRPDAENRRRHTWTRWRPGLDPQPHPIPHSADPGISSPLRRQTTRTLLGVGCPVLQSILVSHLILSLSPFQVAQKRVSPCHRGRARPREEVMCPRSHSQMQTRTQSS